MSPKDKSQRHDELVPDAGETITDLELTDQQGAEQVVGGGQRVRGTVKWIDQPELPVQPAQ